MTGTETAPRRNPIWTLLPVIAFAALAAVFWKGLSGDPSKLPSPLINKPVPAFTLPPISGSSVPGLTDAQLKQGKPLIVNIWASWCGPCRDEHPLLLDLSRQPGVTIVGINNKDDAEDALRFLGTLGNPFKAIGADTDGRVSIDWGGYGVPETFLVDGQGIIRDKIIGPLDPETIRTRVLPFIQKGT